MPPKLPAIFFGHGNPMNALAENAYTSAWASLGANMPRPRAVLAISAHWYVPYTAVTAMDPPRTIHDFGGFPRALFEKQYPASGDPALAHEVAALLRPIEVTADRGWGLDHGTWSVLCHVYPEADVPVVQLSIDETLTTAEHYAIGKALAPLRERGVLIAGSGNLVHNLHAYAWGRHAPEPFEWAVRFENAARDWMLRGEHQPLIDYATFGEDAELSAPTPEHFLPLLYVLATQQPGDAVTFPVNGVDGGSISMLSVKIG